LAVRIRLRRTGTTKKPSYRVVVTDSHSPRDGKFLEILGYYNPLADPAEFKIDAEKAKKWLDKGATPSDTVRSLLVKSEVLEK